jgi:hypothetical protein
MRDWGYGDGESIRKAPLGHYGFIEKTPEALARWVGLDSTALSKVSDDDLVDELEVRLLENGFVSAVDLYDKITVSINKYRLHLKEY